MSLTKRLTALLLALLLCLTLALPALAEEEAPAADPAAFEAQEDAAPAGDEAPAADEAPAENEDPAEDDAAAEAEPEAGATAEPPAEAEEAEASAEAIPVTDGAAADLMLLVQALKFLVKLGGAEQPDPAGIKALGSGLANAIYILLTAVREDDNPQPPAPTTPPESTLIAIVPDAADVEDNSLNEAVYKAVTAWAEGHDGFEAAVYLMTEKEIEAEEDATLPALKRACAAGADIVICTGFGHEGSVGKAAKEYPDVRFLWLDSALDDSSLTNVAAANFAVEQSGYAAGYAAVKEGYKKLGFIGGMPTDEVVLYGYGYVQGARDAAEELGVTVTMQYGYCNAFWPNQTAYDMADGWYKAGTEIIFAAAGGANISVGQATDANHAKMIGVDVAPGENFPGILTSALKDVGTAARILLDKIAGGKWSDIGGRTTHLSAADGVDLLPVDGWAFTIFTKAGYQDLLDSLKSGARKADVNCPDDIESLANEHLAFAGALSAEDLVDLSFIDPLGGWAEYDGLIAAIRAETDTAKRAELMHEAEDILMATGCIVPLYYYPGEGFGTYYYMFNAKSGIFDGKTPEQAACMRQAIALLIDRSAICEIATDEESPTEAGAFIPLGMSDGNGGTFRSAGYYYDPLGIKNDPEGTTARAIELLEAAGFEFGEDGKLSAETPLSIAFITNPGRHEDIAASAAADLAKFGIQMTVTTVRWQDDDENPIYPAMLARGEFVLARSGWIADSDDPLEMLEMWTTDSEDNDCQFGR